MTHSVHLLETGETFQVDENESVLQAALRADVKIAHDCQLGGCGTCRIKLVEGAVFYPEFPMALTEEEEAQGYALACQARPGADLTISVPSSRLTFSNPVRVEAHVKHAERFTESVVHLSLELSAAEPLDYRSGQYVNIWLEDGTSRSFSMASVAHGNLLDFHVHQIPGGRFSDRLLKDIRAGSTLSVEFPLGTFCYHEEDMRPLVMAATGTGLAPIKAILESLLDDEDCPPVSLYWGMRTEQDLYLRDVIESWKGKLYEFDFVPVLSRGGSLWTGRRGYVQQAVIEDFGDLAEHAIYLCGSPNMVADAKSLFTQHGASLDYVYSDSFSFQHSMVSAQ